MRRADEAYGEGRHEAENGGDHADRQYADLRQALADLPGRDRAILSFRYEDGFSTAEMPLETSIAGEQARRNVMFNDGLRHKETNREYCLTVVLPPGAELVWTEPTAAQSNVRSLAVFR